MRKKKMYRYFSVENSFRCAYIYEITSKQIFMSTLKGILIILWCLQNQSIYVIHSVILMKNDTLILKQLICTEFSRCKIIINSKTATPHTDYIFLLHKTATSATLAEAF